MQPDSATPDVLVVGGGAVGVASAYELARAGATVTLLERGATLAWGCSAGNAGLICPSHAAPLATPAALRAGLRWMLRRDSPFYLRPRPATLPWLLRFVAACTPDHAKRGTLLLRELSEASLARHAEYAGCGVPTGFERRGILNTYESAAGFQAGQRDAAALTRSAQVLSGTAARRMEPALGDSVAGAIYYPEEAHCDPRQFVEAVGGAAVAAGVDVRLGHDVTGFRVADQRVAAVETTEGTFHPAIVVLAAGVWTAQLARSLHLPLPLTGGKGYHVDVLPAENDPRVPVFMQESRVIATPLPNRLRLAGTLELAGHDLGLDPIRIAALRRAAARVLPAVTTARPVREVWAGLRPCAPDGLPMIGRAVPWRNLILATGHAMLGLTLAPITGVLVTELVQNERARLNLPSLSPDRFRYRHRD